MKTDSQSDNSKQEKQALEQQYTKKSPSHIYNFRLPDEFSDTPYSQLPFSAVWEGFKSFTTAHGVPHISTTRGPLKTAFWVLVTATCLAVLAYNMQYLFNDYLDFPVNVNVVIRSKNQMKFPAVTICNVNPIRRDLVMQSNNSVIRNFLGTLDSSDAVPSPDGVPDIQGNAAASVVETTESNTDTMATDTISLLPRVERRRRRQAPITPFQNAAGGGTGGLGQAGGAVGRRIGATREDFHNSQMIREILSNMKYEDKMKLGHRLEEMVLGCSFAGYSCNLTTDFDRVFSNAYGNCFVYNWGLRSDQDVAKSNRPGPLYGLEMVINIDQFTYIGDLAHTAGVRVLIDYQGTMPFPEDLGLSVGPGFETSIGMQLVNITRKGYPYGTCVAMKQSDVKRDVFSENLGTVYSNKACEKTCYQNFLISECSCADPQYPKYGAAFKYVNVSACDSNDEQQATCQEEVQNAFAADEIPCDCPMPCQQVVFTPTVSTIMWPSEEYTGSLRKVVQTAAGNGNKRAAFLLQNGFDRNHKKNLAKLVIYFQEFNQAEIYETEKYTLGQFVSGLGGILGLYIGFSILTILEFCELVFDMIALVLVKCCSSNQRKPAPKF